MGLRNPRARKPRPAPAPREQRRPLLDPDNDNADAEAKQRKKILAAGKEFIDDLETEAKQRVGERVKIEDRWEIDLRQHHGRYDTETENRLKKDKRSRLFVNITRKRTHAWEARLSDMLFPTDEKNWGIQPTPVPETIDQHNEAAAMVQKWAERANRARGLGDQAAEKKALQSGQPFIAKEKQLGLEIKDAETKCDAMSRLIEDQLIESNYSIKVRRAIHDACKIGTGIIKGPLISSKVKRRFVKDATDTKVWKMEISTEPLIEWQHVDPYNFFPDLSVPDIDDGEGIYHRWIWNKKELKTNAIAQGFDKDATNLLIQDGPKESAPLFISKLRLINGLSDEGLRDRYHVWEWHGTLDREKLETLAAYLNDDNSAGMLSDAELEQGDEFPVIIWFCQGEILKFGWHPLDSGRSLFSVFQFEKDETCPFGYGVPYMMRDSQTALNGAWRMMMDHGGVTTGPQIIYDPEQLEPEDGARRITGNKLWRRIKAKPNVPAFELHQINSNQQMLAGIVTMAREFADEESLIPLIAQGDQSTSITQTKGGMAILMNASNVVFKRVVKNFDDDMTEPNIQRAYEFNMLHNEDDSVKGDMSVDALGSSVLLVREMQAQNLMAMALQFSAHPVLGPLTKAPELYRKLVQAHQLKADQIVKTDDELKQDQAAQQQQQQPDPEQVKGDMAMKLAQFERDTQIQLAQEGRITEMMKMAQTHNMTLDQINAKLQQAALLSRSKERLFAAEAAVTQRRDRQVERTGAGGKPGAKGAKNGRAMAPASGGGYL